MSLERLRDSARPVATGATSLFLVDLFLSWQRADVRVPGMVHVHHMATGWSGWGLLAGLCAVALLAVLLAGRPRPSAAAALGLAMLAFTALAVVAGDTHVDMHSNAVGVEVDVTRWPAWVGLALAAVAAVATAVPFLARDEPSPQHVAHHGPA
jgi:hypothetical protein